MGVTIPDIGVDLSGYADSLGGALGAVLASVILVSAAFIVARTGWRYLRRVG